MDGYAVQSSLTREASPENPVILKVVGTIVAGQVPISVSTGEQDGLIPCVEIMTGARFPIPLSSISSARGLDEFDACVKIEDTRETTGPCSNARYIEIRNPVRRNQNRRLSGNDFRQGKDIIISKGDKVTPGHIMGLAALGVGKLQVFPKLKVGVLSTGLEILEHDADISANQDDGRWVKDSNGPYIEAFCSQLGVAVQRKGIVHDDPEEFEEMILSMIHEDKCDMVICSGAVSMGKFDFVRSSIEELGAKVRFHKVAIRPGHPLLFATLPVQKQQLWQRNMASEYGSLTPPVGDSSNGDSIAETEVAFFGLPGNPIAAAVCLRFLVVPYLQALCSDAVVEKAVHAVATSSLETSEKSAMNMPSPTRLSKPTHLQAFWHGKNSLNGQVTISQDQGSSQIRPLLDANCWISVPPGRDKVVEGETVEIYSMYPSLGLE